MLTLFVTTTLSDWSNIVRTSWHGCDEWVSGYYAYPGAPPLTVDTATVCP